MAIYRASSVFNIVSSGKIFDILKLYLRFSMPASSSHAWRDGLREGISRRALSKRDHDSCDRAGFAGNGEIFHRRAGARTRKELLIIKLVYSGKVIIRLILLLAEMVNGQ